MVVGLMVVEIIHLVHLEAEAPDTMVAVVQVMQEHQTTVVLEAVAQVILAQQHQPQTQ
jgi:hypothetical protein